MAEAQAGANGSRAAWLAAGWLVAAAIVWLSLTPSPPKIGDFELSDKLQHLAGYGALMFCFARAVGRRRARLAYAALWTAMGAALEFAQDAFGYRSFELADMLANAAGVALGGFAGAARGAARP